jgi:DNA-binding beta-propeller fold protein YncE
MSVCCKLLRMSKRNSRISRRTLTPTLSLSTGRGGQIAALLHRCSLLIVIALVALSLAASPIPPENRIPAVITRTIAAPASSPLIMPTDVAVDAEGNVYVADGVNDRIVKFSPTGELDSVLRGPADSPLSRPIGVAIDPSGNLWISDTGNHRLVVRAANGAAHKIIDIPPAADKPADPTGLVVRDDGRRTYVADCGNHRLLERDNVTGKWTALGEWGISLGQFRWPFMLAMGEENHVLISESIGSRVQQVSSADRWAGQISHFGVALGDLYRPKGVAVDKAGRIFVGDSTMDVIQAFDAGGNCLGALTDSNGQLLRFDHPMGMHFDSSGALYVVELGANRVAVVSLKPPTTGP